MKANSITPLALSVGCIAFVCCLFTIDHRLMCEAVTLQTGAKDTCKKYQKMFPISACCCIVFFLFLLFTTLELSIMGKSSS